MPIFSWVAQTKKGKTLKGELEAADEKIALSQLKRRNLTVTKIKPKSSQVTEVKKVNKESKSAEELKAEEKTMTTKEFIANSRNSSRRRISF